MSRLYQVRVSETVRLQLGSGLMSIIERLMPVTFSHAGEPGTAPAELEIEGSARSGGTGKSDGATSLSVPAPVDGSSDADIEVDVQFANDLEVPFPFRGRVVRTMLSAAFDPLSLQPQDRPLATSPRGVVWSVRTAGPVKHFRSALSLPRLSAQQGFNDAFSGRTFMPVLPLLHLLRHVTACDAYENAPLRASFIVDDPNLHWLRYGFVDYREIARRAARENYHVSFAMIPMDTWFTHQATADLFRQSARRLSLLIHGNNHAREELAKAYSESARISLLQHALSRIEQFERKFALRVCRVMVPPHGACSSDMLAALARLGFDAACISSGSLRAHNRDDPWTRTLGFAPSEVIEGCPVLPRWALSGPVKNNILVAAYLGQPMILRGHHQDLKGGADVLDGLAGFINGLGAVRWSGIGDLCRLNYRWRLEGTSFRLNPFGRTAEVDVPHDATVLLVDDFARTPGLGWRVDCGDGNVRDMVPGTPFDLAGLAGSRIVLERAATPLARISASPPRTSAGLVLRRLLTEARDRLLVN